MGARTHHSRIQTHSNSSVLCLSPATAPHCSSTSPGAPENSDDVLVPVYPGAQHSPWHSQDLQNVGYLSCDVGMFSPLLPLALSG